MRLIFGHGIMTLYSYYLSVIRAKSSSIFPAEEPINGNSFQRVRDKSNLRLFYRIGHFTVVYFVTWPWIRSEAGVDLF